MTRAVYRFSRALTACGVVALMFSGCSSDAEQPAPDQQPPDLGTAAESLVAGLWISPTHWVGFYEMGDGKAFVLERGDVDRDEALLVGQGIEAGQYASFYRRIAHDAANPEVLARLEALDAKVKSYESTAVDPEQHRDPGTLESNVNPMPADQLVAKDFWADMTWFSQSFCNGCIGRTGTREPWAPTTFPVCTSAPEWCTATWQSGSLKRKSKNGNAASFNFGFSPATFAIYLDDPCENSSWWERNVLMDCHYWGRRVAFLDLAARTWVSGSFSFSKSWTLRYEVNGPDNMALAVDTW